MGNLFSNWPSEEEIEDPCFGKEGEELEACKKAQNDKACEGMEGEELEACKKAQNTTPELLETNGVQENTMETLDVPESPIEVSEVPIPIVSEPTEPDLPTKGGRRHRTPRKRRTSRKMRTKKLAIGSSRKSKTSQ